MAHQQEPAHAVEVHEDHDLSHVSPVDELDSDEPRTPTWMPLLGGALFLVGALTLMATRPAGKTTEELRTAAATAAQDAEAARAAELAAQQPAAPDPQAAAAAAAPAPGGPPKGG